MTERVLNMKFNDASGSKFSFAIKDIKSTIEDAAIATAMDTIIAKNVFLSKGGQLISKADAQIVTKETTEISL